MISLNLTEKAYIAGIVDGEGTVTLARKHKNETPSPMVSIANCNLDLLLWVRKKTNCGTMHTRPANKKHRAAYELRIRSDKALNFLKEIKNLLRIKKPHAELLLKSYKSVTVRNGRYNAAQLEEKMKLVKAIRRLNRR